MTINTSSLKFFPWQQAVWDDLAPRRDDPSAAYGNGGIYVVKSKRQIGKSELIADALFSFACNRRNCINILVEPTLDQSRKMFRQLANRCPSAFSIKNAQLLELGLINGSQILFKSAEQGENLRGYTVDGLLAIDEAAYIRDDIFGITSPLVDAHNAPTLICSTPRFRKGKFYEYYSHGLKGDYSFRSYDWSRYDTSALLPAEKLEQYRSHLPASIFTTDYLGEFLDTDSILFRNLRDAIRPASPEPYSTVYLGIDWASGTGQDATALSGINERGEQVLSEHFNDHTTTATVRRILDLIGSLKAQGKRVVVMAEVNGIGRPYCDLMRAERIDITEWVTTNDSKMELVSALQVAFENHAIILRDDPTQEQELSMYECEYHPTTGKVTFNAPSGFHDDTCMALMISWRNYLDSKRIGNYNIRIR